MPFNNRSRLFIFITAWSILILVSMQVIVHYWAISTNDINTNKRVTDTDIDMPNADYQTLLKERELWNNERQQLKEQIKLLLNDNDTPNKDYQVLLQEKLQWNEERQKLGKEIGLLRKEIDNASELFQREIKAEAASISNTILFDDDQLQQQKIDTSNEIIEQQNQINLTTQQLEAILSNYNLTLSKHQSPPKISIPDANRHIAFLHIGKTGGSTISKHLRHGCYTNNWHWQCRNRTQPGFIPNETVTSYRTEEYFHMEYIPPTKLNYYTTILTSVRNPITRFYSAFAFNHPFNAKFLSEEYKMKIMAQTYSCFPSITHLVRAAIGQAVITYNEAHIKANNTIDPIITHWGKFKKKKIISYPINCTAAAQLAFSLNETYNHHLNRSTHPWFTHMVFDYRQYYKSLRYDKELLVMRNEHLWDDWASIHYILSADNATYDRNWTEQVVVPTQFHKIEKKRVYNDPHRWHLHTKEDRKVLCDLLHDEIRLYFMIIMRAVNLNEHDLREAVADVERVCNEE